METVPKETYTYEEEEEDTLDIRETGIREKQRSYDHLKPYQWKEGQSGNPSGRPKDTLKEYLRQKFSNMSAEEKEAWLKQNKVSGDIQWRMAEGNPTEDKNISISIPRPILGGTTVRLGNETQALEDTRARVEGLLLEEGIEDKTESVPLPPVSQVEGTET